MYEGQSVKDFIRDLNALHSALYAVVPADERDAVPELSEQSMKQTLINSVTNELLPILATPIRPWSTAAVR